MNRLAPILLAALVCGCSADRSAASAKATPASRHAAAVEHRPPVSERRLDSTAASAGASEADDADQTESAPSPRPPRMHPLAVPNPVRGLYANRAAVEGRDIWQLVDLARHSEVNALVIDIKDDRGLLLYPSTVGLVHAIGADTAHPMAVARVHALLDSLRAHRIFPIARIVVARDPLLAARRPEWALPRDSGGGSWVNPARPEVWAYAADLASEAAARGFSEVLFDDLEYPGATAAPPVDHSPGGARARARVLRNALNFLRSRLDIPIAVGIAGAAAGDTTDPQWETIAERADVIMPVTFPSAFVDGYDGVADPAAHPYEIANRVLMAARRRNASIRGAADIVPWYQGFTRGAPTYDSAEVRAQIQAGYDNGIHSWMLWNPASTYPAAALHEPVRRDTAKAKKPRPARPAHRRH